MRARIVASVATGVALACTARVVPDDANSGAESEGDDPTATTSGSDELPDPPATSGPAPDPEPDAPDPDLPPDDTRFDVPPNPDPPDPWVPPEDCTHAGGDGFACGDPPAPLDSGYYCVPLPGSGDCSAVEPEAVLEDANVCLEYPCSGGFTAVQCGPDPANADACCYRLEYEPHGPCPGRPFTVHGHERLAAVRAGAGWGRLLTPDVTGLDNAARQALAAAWAECASFEHASIASFSRFILQLLACGAPAALVESAHAALAEELEHARLFFGLASAYAGHPVAPGRLDITACLERSDDLAAVAASTVREGCIAETVSALQIAVAAARTTDPCVAELLHRVAEEELRHAELAWTFIAWLWARGDATERAAIHRAFSNPTAAVPRGPDLSPRIDPTLYQAHGLLPPATAKGLATRALHDLVLPAARDLLRPKSDPHAPAAHTVR